MPSGLFREHSVDHYLSTLEFGMSLKYKFVSWGVMDQKTSMSAVVESPWLEELCIPKDAATNELHTV
jgi:hypothetical protein